MGSNPIGSATYDTKRRAARSRMIYEKIKYELEDLELEGEVGQEVGFSMDWEDYDKTEELSREAIWKLFSL